MLSYRTPSHTGDPITQRAPACQQVSEMLWVALLSLCANLKPKIDQLTWDDLGQPTDISDLERKQVLCGLGR